MNLDMAMDILGEKSAGFGFFNHMSETNTHLFSMAELLQAALLINIQNELRILNQPDFSGTGVF